MEEHSKITDKWSKQIIEECLNLFLPLPLPSFLLPSLSFLSLSSWLCTSRDCVPKSEYMSLGSKITMAVESLGCVWLFASPWFAARQASLSFTISWSLLKLKSIESVMPSNHLILCYPLLPLPSIFPGIRVFSNESALCSRWPKYWSFSFSISPSNEFQGWFPLGLTGLTCCPRDSQESSPALHFQSIYSLVLSLLYDPTLTSTHDY